MVSCEMPQGSTCHHQTSEQIGTAGEPHQPAYADIPPNHATEEWSET